MTCKVENGSRQYLPHIYSAGEGLDMFVTVEIGDTFVDGMTQRTAGGEDVVDFAYVDTCGSTIWLLPILGKVTDTLKLFVKVRGAVVCGD